MKERRDQFGSLPDSIRDERIRDVSNMGELKCICAQRREIGYSGSVTPPPKPHASVASVFLTGPHVAQAARGCLLRDGWS